MNSEVQSEQLPVPCLDETLPMPYEPSPGLPSDVPTEVFDAVAFDAEMEGADNPVKLFKQCLKAADAEFKARFYAGVPAAELTPQRTAFVDALLRRAWQLTRETAEEGAVALIAVGGYGRGELHPGSDIDLMVLLCSDEDEQCRGHIERFITFLWDIGLEVGSSVRSLADCAREAQKDLTVITNLTEARLLAGTPTLFQAMKRQCGTDKLWSSEAFFRAKREEQTERYLRYDDTAYKLEPNIKESPGGLRDIHTIAWVAKRHFGAESLHNLVDQGFLTETEYHILVQGQSYLWQLRWGLHLLTGRREDRLLFDYQPKLAAQFGYRDDGPVQAVEQFMQRYYRTVMRLSRLNEMLLQLFQETLYGDGNPPPITPVNQHFRARNGFLEVVHQRVFEQQPLALLEVFLVMAQHPELQGVRAHTIRLIHQHLHLIDDGFRADPRAKSLFIDLLRQPQGITHELRRMNRYGVLAAYIPAFARIVGRMQYDLFHAYTVDEHTLFVVRNLRRFRVSKHDHEFPTCSRVAAALAKPELLYLTGLFHDIAKGRGGDHSKLGEKDALAFCRSHGLPEFDCRLVAWVVRNHLVMSATAQRQDIADPEVVNRFARRVGDQLHLDYLYLLTVADMRSTNPDLWNSWKGALLLELYNATRRALRRGNAKPIDKAERIAENQQEARSILNTYGVSADATKQLWQTLPNDYFLRYSPDEVAWHTRAIVRLAGREESQYLPMVLIRQRTQRGGTEVFIYTRDQKHLFAHATAALDQVGLDVQDARIITSDRGYVLDSFTVLDASGEPLSDADRLHELPVLLRLRLSNHDAMPEPVRRRVPRRLKQFPVPTEVGFDCDASEDYTVMEVVAADRPGLLSTIGQSLQDCNVNLQSAKIATFGAQVDDFFLLTGADDQPLRQEQCNRLQRTVTERLGKEF